MAWGWKQKVPGREKLPLMALCDHANDEDGLCWPSYEHLAQKCGISRRAVIDNVALLVKRGLVEKIPRKKRSNLFRLNIPGLPKGYAAAMGEISALRGEEIDTGGGEESAPRGEEIDKAGVKNLHPESTTKEPTTGDLKPEPVIEQGRLKAADQSHPVILWRTILDEWNETARAAGLSEIRVITVSWQRMFRTRMREEAFDWALILLRIPEAKGLDKRWADFEFFIKNDRNYAKLLDGKYDRDFRDQPPVSKTAKAIGDLEDFKRGR